MNVKKRLQKVISQSGYCSRRKAEKLICEGKVKVNGKLVNELGFKVYESDIIEINNKKITKNENKVYFLFNKPSFVLTTTNDPKNRKTVMDYFKDIDVRIYPVGRLDYDTSGLLLLTNDGEFTNLITHPSYEINKKYFVIIDGKLTNDEKNQIKNGIVLPDNVRTSNAEIFKIKYDKKSNKTSLELIIHEGRNHQIKNMFIAINHKVLKLKRIQIGILTLQNLKIGQFRSLNLKEVEYFYSKFSKKN